MYVTLKTIHVLAAMAWLGGAVYHNFATMQLAGADPAVMRRWGEVGSAAGKKYYMPASVVTLLAGVGMVLVDDSIGFGDAWITIGFGGIIATMVIGIGFIEKTAEALTEAMSATPPDVSQLQSLGARIRTLSLVDIAILAVVTWAMVAKPGA